MTNSFGHIELRVKTADRVGKFYEMFSQDKKKDRTHRVSVLKLKKKKNFFYRNFCPLSIVKIFILFKGVFFFILFY